MQTTLNKPHLRIIAGRPVTVGRPTRESVVDAARRRHGRPFAHERGGQHQHVKGPAYWTSERIAALAVENEARRRGRT